MSPITPEGSFPKDNHVLTIILNKPLRENIGKKLKIEEDFRTKYDYANSGYIIIHEDRVEVNLKYSKEYWGNHNGNLILRKNK